MFWYSDSVSRGVSGYRTIDLRRDSSLGRRMLEARALTDRVFQMVDPGALRDRPIPERHRIIFYIGHLETFDWNLLRGDAKPFHPAFDRLFAFGIDPVGGGLPDDRAGDWPSEGEIGAYRDRIREKLDAVTHPDLLLTVAIEHRLMHVETLSYMLHQLPPHQKLRHRSRNFEAKPRASHSVHIPAGPVNLGLADSGAFGWDNEFDAHSVDVLEFSIDRYKVTNGEYLEFVRDGGNAPVLWRKLGDDWMFRTMFDEIPLPLDWPVYVSHTDAEAYAAWIGKSLPTEAEWQRAAIGAPCFGNADFRSWDPSPVSAFPESASIFGAVEMWGNGWEWTSSLFEPFPGFKPFPFYPGYSADFFDGRHFVMKGGSPRTAECMIRPSFRNWFQPNYPYVYAGFRCVSR